METKERPLAIHVYRRMLKQAEIYRQRLQKAINDPVEETEEQNELNKEIYKELSSELWYWVAELEKTPEINP